MGNGRPTAADKVVPIYTAITECRVCQHAELEPILHLGDQFLAGFVRAKDVTLPRAPLALVRCTSCGTLQLGHSVKGDLMWREYWYRSGINQTMRDALAEVVRDGEHYSREGTWLDIGANDGYLLSRVGPRYTKVACEPALNMHPLLEEHADHIIPDYFTADSALAVCDRYDVVTSCAMFYDLDRPGDFVRDVAKVLAPSGVWINQLNDAPTMLKSNAFDSICHEHRLYLDVPTIAHLYKQHGLTVVGLSYNSVNGGSVRIAAMKERGTGTSPMIGVPKTEQADAISFARRVARWKVIVQDILDMPTFKHSRIWGLGASTKACCSLQYLNCSERIEAIGDRNPAKKGLLMAGTWIPVVDEQAMRAATPGLVVGAIWQFKDEVLLREAGMRSNGTAFLFPLPDPIIII